MMARIIESVPSLKLRIFLRRTSTSVAVMIRSTVAAANNEMAGATVYSPPSAGSVPR